MSEPTPNPEVRLETDRIATRGVAVLLFSIVVATVVSILLARGLYHWHEDQYRTAPEVVDASPPTTIFHGLIAVERPGPHERAAAEQTLATYGWADREHGWVHIPIERAIDLELAAMTSATNQGGGGR